MDAAPRERPRLVIAHDFAETYGGAERILATAAASFPDAPVWAIAGRRTVARRMGVVDRFHTLLPDSEVLLRHYRALAPIYPALVTLRRLPDADVLLTFSYAFAHGFRTENDAPQVCYCHSPLRFAWSMTDEYAGQIGRGSVRARIIGGMAGAMRAVDRRAADRVDCYVANSQYVAAQIERAYGRDAAVINPPVDCRVFRPSVAPGHDGYYLFCGRLVEPYKQPGIVIDTFRGLPDRLLVAGDGPAYRNLKERAGSNIEFVGHLDDEDLVQLMQRCAATIFPSADDFGMIPLETMACGRPVLAFAGGGALETVVGGMTGEFFRAQTSECLRNAVEEFDPNAYDPTAIRRHAERWHVDRFQEALFQLVADTALARRQ